MAFRGTRCNVLIWMRWAELARGLTQIYVPLPPAAPRSWCLHWRAAAAAAVPPPQCRSREICLRVSLGEPSPT